MRQDRNRRINVLECKVKQKYDPPKLEVIRRDGWAYLFWNNKFLRAIPEFLYDAF